MFDEVVAVRGGGDLGSGVALRLWRAGFPVFILESEAPMAVRRSVAFSEAVYEGRARVEEAEGVLADTPDRAGILELLGDVVPVVVDPEGVSIPSLRPAAVVDAILAKRNTGTSRGMAPMVVGLGPGFRAPTDVHAVVETDRGPHLGRVIWEGTASPDTGIPGTVSGVGAERVVRAPASGVFETGRAIGDEIEAGDVVGSVAGVEVTAAIGGVLRGLLRSGTVVSTGIKVGDVDPRGDPVLCSVVSDKALAVGGGALEAVLAGLYGRRRWPRTLD